VNNQHIIQIYVYPVIVYHVPQQKSVQLGKTPVTKFEVTATTLRFTRLL